MGRHKEFCVETALFRALEIFWRRGYEGASLTELTEAMGITRPSLYATYGNKEALFHKALELYENRFLGFMREALKASTSREVAFGILTGFVDLAAGCDRPLGCMGTQGALACSEAAIPIKQELDRRRATFEAELKARLERALLEGELPCDAVPDDLARFVMVVSCGLAVLAAGGATRSNLMRTAAFAMRAWPATVRLDDTELALTALQ